VNDKTYRLLERIAEGGEWLFSVLIAIWAALLLLLLWLVWSLRARLQSDRWKYKGWYEKLVPMDQWNVKKTCPQCHKLCNPNLTWCSTDCEIEWKKKNG